MARDLATLEQGIEELKTRQEQMARDNANCVEQLLDSLLQSCEIARHRLEQLCQLGRGGGGGRRDVFR